MSRSAVITITKTNRKTVIFSPHLIPSLAIGDPELTLALPPHITAGTGMDAFTHNVEAYISLGYHPICDAVAFGGAKLAWDNLPRVMTDPADIEARANMMMASMMGAIAFQKGLGATHSLAHPLSSDFAMHHGTANAVMLPYVLEFNHDVARERLKTLAEQFGYDDVAEAVRELNRRIGIPARLREFGVSESSLPSAGGQGDSGRLPSAQPAAVHARGPAGAVPAGILIVGFWRKDVIEFALDHETRRHMEEQLEWIEREPENPRPYFHLAQFYRTLGEAGRGSGVIAGSGAAGCPVRGSACVAGGDLCRPRGLCSGVAACAGGGAGWGRARGGVAEAAWGGGVGLALQDRGRDMGRTDHWKTMVCPTG